MIEKYNKLVRDNIPDIIKKQGDFPIIEILDDKNYFNALNQKLKEEVDEYFEEYDIDELVDVIEVINALVKYKGYTADEFEELRIKKRSNRGGFDDRISLVEVERQNKR